MFDISFEGNSINIVKNEDAAVNLFKLKVLEFFEKAKKLEKIDSYLQFEPTSRNVFLFTFIGRVLTTAKKWFSELNVDYIETVRFEITRQDGNEIEILVKPQVKNSSVNDRKNWFNIVLSLSSGNEYD
ncbi:MAG: hypothetical protein QW303_00495 [Nitrososphaerota archaeon]